MKRSRTVNMLVAATLAATLAAPAAAYAIPGRGMLGAPSASAKTTRQAELQKRLGLLKQRITMVLQNRKRAFDNAAARIAKRIDRVSAIADKVETAGGDVSSVRASFDEARRLLDQAKAEEAKAIELFKAVPNATDKKAAFAAARAQAKVAVKTLQNARLTVRNAILNLRAVVNGLKGAQQ